MNCKDFLIIFSSTLEIPTLIKVISLFSNLPHEILNSLETQQYLLIKYLDNLKINN